jgi:ribose transport system ATP-binding protein
MAGEHMSTEAVRVVGLEKTFGGTRALAGVDIDFRAGEIHGVLGQNGAGKSTLFKVLAGFHAPDAGRLQVAGAEVALPLTPTSAVAHGFAFVHQDLALAETLSVMENVCVGAMVTGRFGRVRWREQAEQVERLMAGLGAAVGARTPVGELSPAERAVVAIARGLYARGAERARMLVLDEPTANLTPSERDRLFAAMRRAAAGGTAVVFCTHRLEEVLQITDRVTVLRDGRVVARRATRDVDGTGALVRDILGRDLDAFYPDRGEGDLAGVALEAVDVGGDEVGSISFRLRAGEVLGITGLAGSGHDTVPALLVGRRRRGRVTVGEQPVNSPRDAVGLGLGLLPADRKRTSGVLDASIRENLTLVSLGGFTRRGLVRRRDERRAAAATLERFDVRPRGHVDRRLGSLSGGNQQKVLLAKWLTRPGLRCMILHEPTQGVDVGAKHAILEIVAQLSEQGVAVLLVSSEHEELSHLCDRVLVMGGGRVCAELHAPSADRIAEQCFVAA